MGWLLNQIVVGEERGLQGANGARGQAGACLMPAACSQPRCVLPRLHVPSLAGRPKPHRRRLLNLRASS